MLSHVPVVLQIVLIVASSFSRSLPPEDVVLVGTLLPRPLGARHRGKRPPPPFRSLCRLASRQLAPLAFKNKTRLCLEVVKKRKITPLTEWRPHGSPKILFVTYQKPIKDDKRAKNFLRERLITSKMGFGGFRGGRKSVTRARGASEEGRGQASC